MAAVALVMLILVTGMNLAIVATSGGPGISLAPLLAVYLPFTVLVYVGLIRALRVKLKVDDRGITIQNFWKRRFVSWDDFAEFKAPSVRENGTRSCAAVITKSGKEIDTTAVQARNFNVIAGRRDKDSDKLSARIASAIASYRTSTIHEAPSS